MKKVIIGIHGLANKPEKTLLKKWWLKSVEEGLKNISGSKLIPEFSFEMVHWADLLYKNYVHNNKAFYFDKLYNNEPYRKAKEGALVVYEDSWKDDLRSAALGTIGTSLDVLKNRFGMGKLADWVLEKVMKDWLFIMIIKEK